MGKKAKKPTGPPAPGIPRLPTSHPNYVDVQLQEDNIDLTKRIETLERQLLVKKRIEENLRSSTMKTRTLLEDMEGDLTIQKKTTCCVTSDMTRQYKAMQEDLIHKINSLETTLTEQREDADMARHELQELIRDKTDIIRHKDAVIEQLQLRMDHMASKLTQDRGGQGDGGKAAKDVQEKLEHFSQKVAAVANNAKTPK
eukprot:g8434.t1